MSSEDVKLLKSSKDNIPQYVYDSGISLYITGTNEGIDVSEEDVDEFLQNSIDAVKKDLMSNGSTKDEIDSAVNAIKKSFKDINKEAIKQFKLNGFVNSLISQALQKGIKINQIFMTYDGPVTKAVANAINLNHQLFYNSMQNVLYVNDEILKQPETFDIMMDDISVIDMISISQEEHEQDKVQIEDVKRVYNDLYNTLKQMKSELKQQQEQQNKQIAETQKQIELAEKEQGQKQETPKKTLSGLKSKLLAASAEDEDVKTKGPVNNKKSLKLKAGSAENDAMYDITKQAIKKKPSKNC